MNVVKTLNGDRMDIKLDGKLNALSAPVFEQDISRELDGIRCITIDVGGVEYISSAGIRTLLFLQQTMDEVSGELVIKNVSPIVGKIFAVTGIDGLITIQ